MALAWDGDTERRDHRGREVVEDDEARGRPTSRTDPDDGPTVLRVRLTGAAARAFAKRAARVVVGRPAALPASATSRSSPAGHICPRANGYRR